MNNFKAFLVEGKGVYSRPRNPEVQIKVPHIPLLDYVRKDGVDTYFKTPEERLDTLISDKPVYADSKLHVRMHNMINDMEDKEYVFGMQKKYKGGKVTSESPEVFTPARAKIARILNNGGSIRDVEEFLNSKNISNDDKAQVQRTSIGVYISHVRRAIDHYQRVELKKESPRRMFLGDTSHSKPESPFPGGFVISAVLNHPHRQDDLASLSNEEFHRKHLQRHLDTSFIALDAAGKQAMNIRFSQARKSAGIPNDEKAAERRKNALSNAIKTRWIKES